MKLGADFEEEVEVCLMGLDLLQSSYEQIHSGRRVPVWLAGQESASQRAGDGDKSPVQHTSPSLYERGEMDRSSANKSSFLIVCSACRKKWNCTSKKKRVCNRCMRFGSLQGGHGLRPGCRIYTVPSGLTSTGLPQNFKKQCVLGMAVYMYIIL